MSRTPQALPIPYFIQELLVALRDARYAPAAWLCFIARSWQRSLDDGRGEPALVVSVLRHTALLQLMTLAAILWPRRRSPADSILRQAGGSTLLLLVQQAFIALHLGMAQPEHGMPRFAALGVANFLTSLRGACATLLLSADHRDRRLFALALTIGAATDVSDGAVARCSGGQSRLGRMLDPMADVAFYSAAVVVAVQRGMLPRWFGGVVLVRFLAPTALGIYRGHFLTPW